MSAEAVHPAAAPTARPNVLAYPSATTARYLIFVAAMLCTGLFVGNWVHTETRGDEWTSVILACEAETGMAPLDIGELGQQEADRAECTQDVERIRSAFLFAGTALVTLAAAAVLILAPRVIERRRRLRPLGPKLAGAAHRFAMLAGAAGISSRVRVMIGPAGQRDAFSYGAPLRYRVALPPAIAARWRDTATFDPLIAHELSHVARHDVSLAWIVRSIWYILGPILSVPLIVGLFSDDPSIVLDYSWRVLVLAAVVVLLSNSLLRSREYDADLAAARQLGNPGQVQALVGRARAAEQGRFAWLTARHPSPTERAEVVARPERVTELRFVDGFISAFLAALSLPLLVSSFTTLLAMFGRTEGVWVISAGLIGPILGATIGLAVWRAAVVARFTGQTVHVAGLALGVGVGFAAGEAASLAQTGTGYVNDLEHPWWLLVMALAGIGATVVSASYGELWADFAPVLGGARRAWLTAFLVNALLFSTMLWAALQFETALDIGGWSVARAALVSGLSTWPVVAVVLAFALAAAVPLALRRRLRPAPSWLIEGGPLTTQWPVSDRVSGWTALTASVAAGLTAGMAMIAYRAVSGSAELDEELWLRFWSFAWVAAAASCVVTLTFGLLFARRGVAVGLVGGPIAALTATGCFLAMNTYLGGTNTWDFTTNFLLPALSLGFYLSLVVGPVGLLRLTRRGGTYGPPVRLLTAVAATTLTAAVAASATLAARDALVWPFDLEETVGLQSEAAVLADFTTYLTTLVPEAQQRYQPIEDTLVQIDSGAFPGQEVTRLDEDVIGPLRELAKDMTDYHPATTEVAAVHAELVASLDTLVQSAERFRAAYLLGDQAAYDDAVELFEIAQDQRADWEAGRTDLAAALIDE